MKKNDGGLRQLFRSHLPQVDWLSVESPTDNGIPDCNGCYNGVEFWIEFKFTSAYAVVIRPAQIAWGQRRARAGGRVFVAVRRKAGVSIRREGADELWLVPIALAFTLSRSGLSALEANCPEVVAYTGGPARWDWEEALSFLTA